METVEHLGSELVAITRAEPFTINIPTQPGTLPAVDDRIGLSFGGCCIVDQVDSTTYVPSNWAGSVDEHGNLVLKGRKT